MEPSKKQGKGRRSLIGHRHEGGEKTKEPPYIDHPF